MATPDFYYDAALICITLVCERCQATLDPDQDLGPGMSYTSDGWFVLLADEAYRRGWLIDMGEKDGNITATCPTCARIHD
jgi:hypothetical protein